MKKQSSQNTDVWKKVLEKQVSSDKLSLAKSVTQEGKPYEVQIFEVLAAETLNLHDPQVDWQVTTIGHDGGVDLIGYEKRKITTPFVQPFHIISLGQVKRRGSSYRYDNFKSDVGKINEYCLKNNLFKDKSLKQLLFVVSTSAPKGIQRLKERMEKEDNPWLLSQKSSYVGFIDADDLVKSWKLNYRHFENILKDALSPEELDLFKNFVDQFDYSWISATIKAPNCCGIGEPILQTLTFKIDTNELDVDVFIKWIPPEDSKIQLIHPLRLCDPRQSGLPFHIHKSSQLVLAFRGLEAGILDFGFIELHSSKYERLIHLELGNVQVYDSFFPYFFNKPNRMILQELEQLCADVAGTFIPTLVHGSGGIGKSTLISEVFIHAAARGFFCVDVAQPKDRYHERYLIKELIKNLLFPNQMDICFDSSLVKNMCRLMGQNFNVAWEGDLTVYFTEEKTECCIRSVAECLTTAIFFASAETPVLIWISDLHWMSEETVKILRVVIDELNVNQKSINHRILCIFEGRDDECLLVDNHPFFPVQWHTFMENNLLNKYPLKVWEMEECREFLEQLFVIPPAETILYDALIDDILKRANGVPMHMLELIKMLFEKGNAILAEGQRLLIVNHNYSKCLSDNILIAIQDRIGFYRKIVPDFIDVMIIFAYLGCDIPGHLVSIVMKGLNSKYANFHIIKKQSAFIMENDDSISFSHEHYLTAFRSLSICNEEALEYFISYYEKIKHVGEKERFLFITLQKKYSQTNLAELRREILFFLNEEPSFTICMSLYEYLLEIPSLKNDAEDIPDYYILFQLCELNIRQGSWKSAQYYLQKQLDLPYKNDLDAIIYRVKAKQEIANILADRLFFEKAAREAEDGLELVDLWLDKNYLSTYHSALYREKSKLLARLAVCYWFAGDLKQAARYQKESYQLACRQKDRYSAAHVLYEIGTLLFHDKYQAGINIMKTVRKELKEIPDLKLYEESLIEIQTLIGLLMKVVAENDWELLKRVKLKTRELSEYYRDYPNSYEEFICHTIRGICFCLENLWQEALLCFSNGLKKATESDMPNLEWKALFNIAQLYSSHSPGVAYPYAIKARTMLDATKKENPRFAVCLENMLQPVYKRLDLIERKLSLSSQELSDELTMLAVQNNGCLFVIMN